MHAGSSRLGQGDAQLRLRERAARQGGFCKCQQLLRCISKALPLQGACAAQCHLAAQPLHLLHAQKLPLASPHLRPRADTRQMALG